MNVKLDPTAHAPTRAHPTDAGLDLYSPVDAVVWPHDGYVIDTGVHVQLPPGTCGLLVSKSGLNVNHGITSTGLIDETYSGSIRVKLYNHSGMPYAVSAGDKVSQLVVIPIYYAPVEIVDELDVDPDGRGENGFGSTGK